MRSNVYRLLVSCEQAPKAQYPLTISYNSIVVHPPYKKLASLTKKRFVALHSQKRLRGVAFITSERGYFCFWERSAFL